MGRGALGDLKHPRSSPCAGPQRGGCGSWHGKWTKPVAGGRLLPLVQMDSIWVTRVTDLRPGVTRGQMGHPSTHMLGGTHAEPEGHTSPTSASSTHTDRIMATCQGTLALSLSFSRHLGLSAQPAGDNNWRWAGPGSWAQSPSWGSRPGPDIRRPGVLA